MLHAAPRDYRQHPPCGAGRTRGDKAMKIGGSSHASALSCGPHHPRRAHAATQRALSTRTRSRLEPGPPPTRSAPRRRGGDQTGQRCPQARHQWPSPSWPSSKILRRADTLARTPQRGGPAASAMLARRAGTDAHAQRRHCDRAGAKASTVTLADAVLRRQAARPATRGRAGTGRQRRLPRTARRRPSC